MKFLSLLLAMLLVAPPQAWSARKSKIQKASEDVIHKLGKSNTKVQPPQSNPLPSTAPKMPTVVPMPENPTGAEVFFKKVANVMTSSWDGNIFVWLPAISTDPNTGPTLGILPVLVLTEKVHGHIRHLLAPSITHNDLFGVTSTMRYYYYPTDSSQLFAIASISQDTNREARMRYENSSFFQDQLYVRVEGGYQVDGSPRFFGIGPQTIEEDEKGYVSQESRIRGSIGVNFFENCRFSVGMRYRQLKPKETIIPNTKSLVVSSPGLFGIQESHTITNEIRLLWDSRDLPTTPSKGNSGEIYIEKTHAGFGSDARFFRFGLEGKQFFPWKSPKHVSVMRAAYEQVKGPAIPFYELALAGGRESLRGFGEGRFADQGKMIFNIEHRVQIASLSLMGVQTNFEVGPFFDLGTIFPNYHTIQRKYFRAVYGASFRAAVKPNVVGAVDVGIGQEGTAVYVGINYPF